MLPSYSLTREAVLNDPDAVEAMAKAGLFDGSSTKKTVAISESTPVLEAIYDVLLELRISNQMRRGRGTVEPPPDVDMPLVRDAQAKAKQDDYETLKALIGG